MLGLGFGLNKTPLLGGASSFVGALDPYPNAAAVYCVYRLYSSYTGSLLRVRRSSDNTEQDIGYDSNGYLDTASLLAFVGANDGFVTTWYDQSGNSYDASIVAASAQPQIVSSGSLMLENTIAALDFNGTSHYLSLGGTEDAGMVGDISVFSVNKNLGASTSVVVATGLTGSSTASLMQWSISGATSNRYQGTTSDGTTRINEFITATNYGSQVLVSMINDEDGDLQMFADGVASTGQSAVSPMNDANYPLEIGRDPFRSSYYFSGTQQALILYASDQSANRTGIESALDNLFFLTPLSWDDTEIWDDTETWTE